MKFLNNLDLKQNEIQNFRVHNLAEAPESPVIGQHYFNTTDNTEYVWNGTKWIDALSQGDYTFTNGLSLNAQTRTVTATAATSEAIGSVIVGENIDVNNGTISIKNATNAQKGVNQVATDLEAEAGTDEIKTINAKQLQTKVTKNAAITGATKTKITYDEKGLVTAGADLSEADIPAIHLAKVTDVTATAEEVNVLDGITASTEELNILDGVTADKDEINILDGATLTTDELNYVDGVTAPIQEQLDDKVAKNTAITAGTATKITYDAKGLVTAGANLSASDIPALDSAKITTMGSYEKAGNAAAITTADSLDTAIGKLEFKADAAVVANEAITGATKTKITYDAKGLVTAGADLSEADIPALHLAKVTDVTATAEEVNVLDGVIIDTTELNQLDGVTDNVQEQLDAKVEKNADITAGTKCKITYDAKGLVTGGADLSEADIPTLGSAKIGNLTGYAKAAEIAPIAEGDTLNVALGKVQASLDNKIALTALSIDSASTDYLTYDSATGKFGAKVSNTIADDDTNLVTGEAVYEAIKDHIALTDLSIDSASANYAEYDNTTGKFSIKAGVANGLATLDAEGLVPAAQLPSFVDDAVELLDVTATAPATCAKGDKYFNTGDNKIYTATAANTWGNGATPETGKIYVNLANNMSYRWSGSTLVQIGADKLLGFNGTIEGDGTTTTFAINHNLGTRNVVFEIYEANSPYEKVYVQVLHTSLTALNVVFGAAPAVGENYIITVIAIG